MLPAADMGPGGRAAPAECPALRRASLAAAVRRWAPPVAAILVLALAHLAWIGRDHASLGSDEAMYVRAALRLRDIYAGDAAPRFSAFFDALGSRQPLPAWIAGLFMLPAGDLAFWARASNLVPLAALVLAVYALAYRRGGAGAGIAAALVAALYPPLWKLSHVFWAHYWLVAAVAVALLVLERTRGLATKRASVELGVALGLGLLTRHFFVVFAAVPLGLAALELWRGSRELSGPALAGLRRRLAWVLAVTLALALPHYSYAWAPMRHTMKAAAAGVTSCWVPPGGVLARWLWSPAELLTRGSLVYGIGMIALLAALAARWREPGARLLLAACAGGLVLVNGYECKVLEYVLPVVPPVVAGGIGAAWHSRRKLERAGVRALAVVLVAAGGVFAASDFGPALEGLVGEERAAALVASSLAPASVRPAMPDPDDAPTFELGRVLAERERRGPVGRSPVVELVADYPMEANRVELALVAARVGARGGSFFPYRPAHPAALSVEALLRADYLILLDHANGRPAWRWQVQDVLKPALATLAARGGERLLGFELAGRFATSVGPTFLYAKTREPTADDVRAVLVAALDTADRERFPELAGTLAAELAVRSAALRDAPGAAALTERALAAAGALAPSAPAYVSRVECLVDRVRSGAPLAEALASLSAAGAPPAPGAAAAPCGEH